jgi:hypothetical protein
MIICVSLTILIDRELTVIGRWLLLIAVFNVKQTETP